MSIKDARDRMARDETAAEALAPKRIFIFVSAFAALGAVLVFLNEDVLVDTTVRGSATAYALSLAMLVLIGAFGILCYRSPALGNRLLGYAGLMGRKSRTIEREGDTSVHYGRTSAVDTALEAKRRSTRRKTARHQRRHLAEATRQMQQSDAPGSSTK